MESRSLVIVLVAPIVPHARPADGDQVPEEREVTSGASAARAEGQASGTRSTASSVVEIVKEDSSRRQAFGRRSVVMRWESGSCLVQRKRRMSCRWPALPLPFACDDEASGQCSRRLALALATSTLLRCQHQHLTAAQPHARKSERSARSSLFARRCTALHALLLQHALPGRQAVVTGAVADLRLRV